MKRLSLLVLAAIPLLAFGDNFIYYDHDYYDDDYWYDEYWEDDYWCDGYWVYYPHGYYCVRYVWWYPWWWDYYWWRSHWCHHFSWDFFYCGFYVVWYEHGCYWFRPRYGRWVRYRLPYSYHEVWRRAKKHGIHLPKKAPREIIVPYKENKIMKLTRQQDPKLFERVNKEHRSGNLEKMRKQYTTKMEKEITTKNQAYKKNTGKMNNTRTHENQKYNSYDLDRRFDNKAIKKHDSRYNYRTEKIPASSKSESRITEKERNRSKVGKNPYLDDDNGKADKNESKAKETPSGKYARTKKNSSDDKYTKSQKHQKSRQYYDRRDKQTDRRGSFVEKR